MFYGCFAFTNTTQGDFYITKIACKDSSFFEIRKKNCIFARIMCIKKTKSAIDNTALFASIHIIIC